MTHYNSYCRCWDFGQCFTSIWVTGGLPPWTSWSGFVLVWSVEAGGSVTCPQYLYQLTPSRYIQLNLELLQFTDRDLPCNFTLTISDSMSVFGVKQIIQDKFGHSLVDLNVSSDILGPLITSPPYLLNIRN